MISIPAEDDQVDKNNNSVTSFQAIVCEDKNNKSVSGKDLEVELI